MKACEEEERKLSDAQEADADAREEYRDQVQAAGEASFFSEFHRVAILNAAASSKGAAPLVMLEKSMSALEKQGTAERAQAKVARARRAMERASRSASEARASLERCREAHELEPVSLSLTSTLELRTRFFEERILPPHGWSGTLPTSETTHVVEARSVKIKRSSRGYYRVVLTIDEVYSAAPSHSTVVDERGRPMTHTITEQVTSVKPGTLDVLLFSEDSGDPMDFSIMLVGDERPCRSGQRTLTIRDPEGGCHTIPLPFVDVPSVWPNVFRALRMRDSSDPSGEVVYLRGWTWREQGDQCVFTRTWSTPPGTLLTLSHGEVTLLAERSSMEVTTRWRRS